MKMWGCRMYKAFYDKKLLEKAAPSLIISKFTGKQKLRQYNWPIKFIRWILRLEPVYDSVLPPLSKGNKIKFRRYKSLGKPMKYTEDEGSEAEAILKTQVEQTASMIDVLKQKAVP